MDVSSAFQRGRGGPGGWWILDGPEPHLGEDVLVPDLGGWRRERMPVFLQVPFFTLPPDWVCEVLSPSSARLDRILKMRKYARAGIPHVWLVDPLAETLEVFRLENGFWVLASSHEGTEMVRAEPFDAIELSLGDLFPGTEERSGEPGGT